MTFSSLDVQPLGQQITNLGAGTAQSVGTTDFALIHVVKTGSGAQPVSYSIGTGGGFPGIKVAGV
jgi:hypothetical protein